MMRKRFISLLLLAQLLVTVGLTGCSDNNESNDFSVTAGRCDNHRIIQKLNVSGTVEVEDSGVYTVSTKFKNYSIKSLNVRKGDEIKEGDIVCEFDTTEIEKNIKAIEDRLSYSQSRNEQSVNGLKDKISILERLLAIKLEQIEENRQADQIKYDEAVCNYNSAKSELENAESEYNTIAEALQNSAGENQSYNLSRCEDLIRTIGNKYNEVENYQLIINDLKTKLDDYPYQEKIAKIEAENEISEIQFSIDSYQSDNDLNNQLKELKYSLENSVVYAPCSGTVRDVNITCGQISNTGSLITIVQMDKIAIRTSLNDYDSVRVKEGMGVEITAGTDKFNGTVSKLNRVKGEEGFDTFIELNDSAKINIGLLVSNSIKLYDKEVLSVSRDALINDNGSFYVYVAVSQDNGSYIAEYKPVTIGVQDEKNAEICSGLNKGDLVIMDNIEAVSDGMIVNVSVSPEDN